jgi:hypothetical protein
MKQITHWIIGAPSLLVILVAFLCIISTFGAKSFLTKGINVGMEGIVTVIRTGETTLGRLENIVSETLPTTITAVESMLATDREPSHNISVIQEKAVLRLRTELLPEIDQLMITAGTITQIMLSANETLMIVNTLPLIQLPPLPTKRWQSLNNRLSALRDSASGLMNLLMPPRDSEFMINNTEIRQNVQMLQNISTELEDRLLKIKVDLSTTLEKIEAIHTKITSWITWLLMGIFLVMFWVAGGQIYLLWHFWKTRFIRRG